MTLLPVAMSGSWKYGGKVKKWKLPDELTEGFIEDEESGKVLGVNENINDSRIEVLFEEKLVPTNKTQIWFRGATKDIDGYKDVLTLTNSVSEKVLTASTATNLTLKGTIELPFKITD